MKLPPILASFFSLLFASAFAQTAATTLNLSTDLVRLGIATSDMTPNQPSLDSTVLFENAVKYLRSHPTVTLVTANPGAYYFLSASTLNTAANVAIQSPNNTATLTFDFQGSDLYTTQPGKFGFAFVGLSNVVVQNFTIDSLQHLYTQVQVTAVNAAQRQIQYTTMAGWQKPTTLEALDAVIGAAGDFATGVFVFRNGQPLAGGTRMGVAIPHAYTDTSLTLAASVPTTVVSLIQPGDIAVINSRGTINGTMLFGNTLNNCTLRNIRIYDGVVGFRSVSVSNSLFERIYVMPRPGTDRLVSIIAGGIVPATLGPNNTIRLCRVIRNSDDGYAPNTFVFGRVGSVVSATSVQVGNEANTTFPANNTLAAGTPVTFEQPDGTIVATATIASVAAAPAINGIAQLVFNLNQPVPASIVGSLVYATDPALRGGMTLERNTVQQQAWGNGFALWGLLNTTFTGNYAYHTAWNGVSMIHALSTSDWIVPATINATISNNVVDGAAQLPDANQVFAKLGGIVSANRNPANGQPYTTSPNQNVSVVGNFVANPSSAGIWLGNVNGGVVEGNYLLNPNNNPNLSFSLASLKPFEIQPLVTLNSINVRVAANTIDKASGQFFVTDTGFQQLAAYAPGGTIRLNAYNLGAVSAPVITLTDADGKSWPVPVRATSTHALDVQLPSAIGLGGAYLTLKSGGVSYLGTLFVDSQDNIPAINQATYFISPSTTNVSADGGTVSFLVVTQPGAAYQASTAAAFATATATASGSGTGVITVSLARNTGAARTATIEIASQPITLTQAGATDPVIVTQPQSQAVKNGDTATFTVSATGAQSYQWNFNDTPIAGATTTTLTVSGVTAANAGTYTVVAKNASGSTTSNGALLTLAVPVPTTINPGRLINLSVLAPISSAGDFFSLGYVVSGASESNPKPVVIRAAGPSLGALGVGGALADPKLELFVGSAKKGENDDWGGSAATATAMASVGAFAYTGPTSRDAAVVANITSSDNSVKISAGASAPNGTGTVIAEVYEAPAAGGFTATTPRLVNFSVLKNVGTSVTLGFVIGGENSKTILVRAIGPTLGAAPFNVAGAMADPKVELFDATGRSLGTNDNWGGTAALSAAFTSTAAFALPATSKDAALVTTLAPGGYSVVVTPVVGTTGGTALLEVYEVP